MEPTHKNWFTEHAEGIFIWGMGLLLLAVAMYIAIRH
jgi:hypothetical protein